MGCDDTSGDERGKANKEAPEFWIRSIFIFMAELIRKIVGGIKLGRQPAFFNPKMSFSTFSVDPNYEY